MIPPDFPGQWYLVSCVLVIGTESISTEDFVRSNADYEVIFRARFFL